MLSNLNSSTSTSSSRKQWDPLQISKFNAKSTTNCVAWYDFSDASTVFENLAGTDPAESGDSIMHIKNKAYDGTGALSKALNTFIGNTASAKCPTWTYSTGGAGNTGFATFDGTDDALFSGLVQGNIDSGQMSGSRLTHSNFTVSFVVTPTITGVPAVNRGLCMFTDQTGGKSSCQCDNRNGYLSWMAETDGTGNISGVTTGTNLQYWVIVGGTASSGGADVNTLSLYKDGVQQGSTVTSNFAPLNRDLTQDDVDITFWLGVGDNRGAMTYYSGRMYEYIQYDKALGKEQIDQLNRYYSRKYLLRPA